MKRLLLVVLSILVLQAKSQENIIFQKGTKSIGLEKLHFGLNDDNFNIGGSASYNQFLTNRLVYGAKFSSSNFYSDGLQTNKHEVEAQFKYYFSNINKRLVFYAYSGLNLSYKHTINNEGLVNRSISLDQTLGIGAEFFIQRNLSVFGEIGTNNLRVPKPKLTAGVRYYINRKAKKKKPRSFH